MLTQEKYSIISLDMNIGLKVKQLRKKRGLSQHALAVSSGMQKDHISKIELGKILNIRITSLEKIAKGLGVQTRDLIA